MLYLLENYILMLNKIVCKSLMLISWCQTEEHKWTNKQCLHVYFMNYVYEIGFEVSTAVIEKSTIF